MSCEKCFQNLFNKLIPVTILLIFLLQIYATYAQYSPRVIENKNLDINEINGRNTMTVVRLSQDKQYYFNNIKIQQSFENNALMNINYLKNSLLTLFELINNAYENKNNIIIYMFYYLIAYDIICLIILCYFISGSFMAGIIKIIYQIARFYFNSKRIKKFNKQMNISSIIKSKIENIYLIRKWNIFCSEGYLIIEYLCNFIIIFDILLIIYIYRKKNYRKKINLYKEIKAEKKRK